MDDIKKKKYMLPENLFHILRKRQNVAVELKKMKSNQVQFPPLPMIFRTADCIFNKIHAAHT